jgi:hypothetical protein
MSASDRLQDWKNAPAGAPGTVNQIVMIDPARIDEAEAALKELGAVKGAEDAAYKIIDYKVVEGSKATGTAVAYAKRGRKNLKVNLTGVLMHTLDEFKAE